MEKLKMTLMDVYHAMRDAGITSSPKAISDGIVSGAYPFGRVTNVGETKRKTFEIFRVDFYAWLKTRIPEKE